jgi:stage III sporulation protein AE
MTDPNTSAAIERAWTSMREAYGSSVPAQGDLGVSGLFHHILRLFWEACMAHVPIVGSLCFVILLSLLLETTQSLFERNVVHKLVQQILFLASIGILVGSVQSVFRSAGRAVEMMVAFMEAMIPVFLTLMASLGNVVTVTLVHPVLVTAIELIGHLVAYLIFPMLMIAILLQLVSMLSGPYSFTHLAGLFRRVAIMVLGIVLSIFLGVTSIQGLAGAASDGVALRTSKSILSQFIPGVGRAFAEATDTAIGASLLMKNTVGISGLVVIIWLCVLPALKIAAVSFLYNASAAVLQPLGNHPILGHLQALSRTLLFLMACVLAIGFLFFFCMTILIAAGNWSYMYQ